MSDQKCALLGETKSKILDNLLGEAKSPIQLANVLGIYESAVRRHLDDLERKGIVSWAFKKGIGRPKKLYTVTPVGRELFPKRYDLLLNVLIDKLLETQGREALFAMLRSAGEQLAKSLTLDGKPPEEKLSNAIATLGGLANCTIQKKEDGKLIVQVKDCLFSKVARNNPDLICAFHATFFQHCTGAQTVHLEESMAKGCSICTVVLDLDAKNE
ncbi:MAG: helix-turn-helix transcriptional regulator [Candidatus Bathyarchaeia archaeon]